MQETCSPFPGGLEPWYPPSSLVPIILAVAIFYDGLTQLEFKCLIIIYTENGKSCVFFQIITTPAEKRMEI